MYITIDSEQITVLILKLKMTKVSKRKQEKFFKTLG